MIYVSMAFYFIAIACLSVIVFIIIDPIMKKERLAQIFFSSLLGSVFFLCIAMAQFYGQS